MIKSELLQTSLYEWLSPDEMLAAVDTLRGDLGHMAMRRPGTEYREAFVAARFAKHRMGERVRLLRPDSNPTPDFAILLNGSEFWFETTESGSPRQKTQSGILRREG